MGLAPTLLAAAPAWRGLLPAACAALGNCRLLARAYAFLAAAFLAAAVIITSSINSSCKPSQSSLTHSLTPTILEPTY